ncbi:MAG: ACP phosphodiesterase [Cytophagaceae bacterium]
MNFLAHLYLSGENEGIRLGNFIADAVKGQDILKYNPEVRQGIILHRKIDEFTDVHNIVRSGKSRLYSRYGKYSAVIIDIFYDHFLAVNWKSFSSVPYDTFVKGCYKTLLNNQPLLPDKVSDYLPHMIEMDWLGNYIHLSGIERTLYGMSRRAKHQNNIDKSIEILHSNFADFESEFLKFFPELIKFVKNEGIILI